MLSDEFPSLAPVSFFEILTQCHYTQKGLNDLNDRFLLPLMGDFCGEDSFANVFMGWNEEGLFFSVDVHQPFQEAVFPEVELGDSVELFIDTRDVKTSGYNTRFCHHFFFLPKDVEGVIAGEKTHFRTDDKHDLCNSDFLLVKPTFKKRSYRLQISIPSSCLYGFDPSQFKRIGFSYRINRYRGHPQHFSAISKEYKIEQQPSLWSSIELIR